MLNTAASTLYRYSESPLSRQIRGSAVLRETLALRLRAGADPALHPEAIQYSGEAEARQ